MRTRNKSVFDWAVALGYTGNRGTTRYLLDWIANNL